MNFQNSNLVSFEQTKLTISRNCLYEKSFPLEKVSLSFEDIINFTNKYFIVSICEHLLIFNFLNFELIKEFVFLRCPINKSIFRMNIIKKSSINDNEFFLFIPENVILIEMKEINLNEKQTISLNIIAQIYFNKYQLKYRKNLFTKLDIDRFYTFQIAKRDENDLDYFGDKKKLNNFCDIYS